MTPRLGIAVVHPEGQHSNHLAAALQAEGLLAAYWHGRNYSPDELASIPVSRRKRHRWFTPLRRAFSRLPMAALRRLAIETELAVFDRLMACRLRRGRFAAVVAYEGSAKHIFRAAKAQGALCILDAASVHHAWQRRSALQSNSRALVRRKDEEIALADLIITCSPLAARSYAEAGVPEERLFVNMLAADLALFHPPARPQLASIPAFCSAGHISAAKGSDIILSACAALRSDGLDFSFAHLGESAPQERSLLSAYRTLVQVAPRRPQADLAGFFQSHDVFVLASRFDSFGMVVAEALACGTPVIVSDQAGASALIEEGVNGWVVPAGDADALTQRMGWICSNVAAVRTMRDAARRSVANVTWARYRRDAAGRLAHFVSSAAGGAP